GRSRRDRQRHPPRATRHPARSATQRRAGGNSPRLAEVLRPMRRLAAIEYVFLDGVVQAPGHAAEDPDGGFEHGGWTDRSWPDTPRTTAKHSRPWAPSPSAASPPRSSPPPCPQTPPNTDQTHP